jgi:hypothetical protein
VLARWRQTSRSGICGCHRGMPGGAGNARAQCDPGAAIRAGGAGGRWIRTLGPRSRKGNFRFREREAGHGDDKRRSRDDEHLKAALRVRIHFTPPKSRLRTRTDWIIRSPRPGRVTSRTETVPSGPVLTAAVTRCWRSSPLVTDLEGLLADPYLAETGFFEQVEHPSEGRMLTPAIPVAFSASPGASFRLPPRLCEQTREVLAELGYSEADIRSLRSFSREQDSVSAGS